MAKKFLEFGHRTKQRLGSYAGSPGAIEITVGTWHRKEGEIIEGKKNSATGTITGEIVVELESSEKGIIEIDAIADEIGAKIVKILMLVGYKTSVDFSSETLRLAILETNAGGKDDPDIGQYLNKETEPDPGATTPPAQESTPRKIPITPVAKQVAIELGVDLGELTASLPKSVSRVSEKHVREFYAEKNRDGDNDGVKASPDTRKFARNNNVDLKNVKATGPGGIIKKSDVENFIKSQALPPEEASENPVQEFEDWEVELYAPKIVIPTKMRLAVARNLRKAKDDMALVGGGRDIDFAPLLSFRIKVKERFEEDNGIELRLDHFFVAAVTKALKNKQLGDAMKKLNARWERLGDGNERMVFYGHINFAIAIAGPSGLVTPVIKRCEEKTFVGLAKAAEELIQKAMSGRLTMKDFIGVTFTVNNTGVFGDEYPDPIPNPGTSGIVAFAAARRICACSKEEWRTCSHSKPAMLRVKFDHQILDGHEIGPFMGLIKDYLEEPEQLLYLSND